MDKKLTENTEKNTSEVINNKLKIRWRLLFFDVFVFVACAAVLFFTSGRTVSTVTDIPFYSAGAFLFLVLLFRFIFKIYSQIWRYGGTSVYLKLILSDTFACVCSIVLSFFMPGTKYSVSETISLVGINLLLALSARVIYGFCYKYSSSGNFIGKISRSLLRIFGIREHCDGKSDRKMINIVIVGAGKDGIALADALAADDNAVYKPVFFVDIKKEKIGRRIRDVQIVSEEQMTREMLMASGVAMVVFALPDMNVEKKKALYE